MAENDEVLRTLKRAQLRLEEGQHDLALAELEAIEPENEEQRHEKQYLLGWYCVQRRRWSDAERYLLPLYQSRIEHGEQAQDRARKAIYLQWLGDVAVNLNRYEDASRHYQKCLKLIQDRHLNHQQLHIKARCGLATTCLMSGFYSEAIRQYIEALELTEYDDNNEDIPDIFYGLCDAYRHIGKFSDAYDYGIMALEVYMKRGNRYLEGRIRNLLGRICYQQGQLREASDHYTEALGIATIYDISTMIMANFTGLADVRLAADRFSEARRFCQLAREAIDRVKDEHIIGMMYLVTGKVAQEEAQHAQGEAQCKLLEEALDWFKESDRYLSSIQTRITASELHGRWAQVLEQLDRQHEAISHWKAAYQVISSQEPQV
jgi:tetratricopeptide (TPR) repeat protein